MRFGDLQLVPVGDGLIYVRPYYVAVPQETGTVSAVTEFRFVIVSYNDNSVLTPTITEGLRRLFPGFDADVGDRIGAPTEPEPDTGDADEPAPSDGPVLPSDAAECRSWPTHCSSKPTPPWRMGTWVSIRPRSKEGRQRLKDALAILKDTVQN